MHARVLLWFAVSAPLLACRTKVDSGDSAPVDDSDRVDDSAPFVDNDGDGYAAEDGSGGDCDDADPAVNPAAAEVCDGVDNDCDGLTDDADDSVTGGATWYADVDQDGYGVDGDAVTACAQPDGRVPEAGDCDDADPAYHPGASEADCTDPGDYNCDGSSGYADADLDGWPACQDCDDADAAFSPDAVEVCDSLDNDCDSLVDDDDPGVVGQSTWYVDGDADGYGYDAASQLACVQPAGSAALGGDCDDTDAAFHPDAADAATWYADADGDGEGGSSGVVACEAPAGSLATSTDCQDSDPSIYAGATETCDGLDDDCDGLVDDADPEVVDRTVSYADIDGDGYGDPDVATTACAAPAGNVTAAGDCDDAAAAVNPGAEEVCDDVDDDCDGAVDGPSATDAGSWHPDADGDGYGDASTTVTDCVQPAGAIVDGSDCDDHQVRISPAETEVCDGFDNDCDGAVDGATATDAQHWYSDMDGDGYGDPSTLVVDCTAPAGSVTDGTDCDDTDALTHPDAVEYCGGPDHDCDSVPPPTECASCLEILDAGSSTGDGIYTIEPAGAGSDVDVWCDMTTDGGGWTLAQRTVWDWSDSSLLQTDYATWYGYTLGDPSAGAAFRLAGQYWDDLDSGLEHMLVHTARDASTGEDCDPLYYLGSGGAFTITASTATLSSVFADVSFTSANELSTTDTGPYTTCVNDYDADPWFYGYCCTTCPTYGQGYWSDEPHPMASYVSDTPDMNGNRDVDVCPSGAAVSSYYYEGMNAMEYYVR